jgi:hypothetical protein
MNRDTIDTIIHVAIAVGMLFGLAMLAGFIVLLVQVLDI